MKYMKRINWKLKHPSKPWAGGGQSSRGDTPRARQQESKPNFWQLKPRTGQKRY